MVKFIGFMLGISMDGVDVVFCEIFEYECIMLGVYFFFYFELLLCVLYVFCVFLMDEVNIFVIVDRWVVEVFVQVVLGFLNKYQVFVKMICVIGFYGQIFCYYLNSDI